MRIVSVRAVALSFLCLVAASSCGYAQTMIIGTRTSTDTTTGRRTVTYDTTYQVAQDVTPLQNIVELNPIKFFGAYNLAYYRKFSDKTVGGFGAMLSTTNDPRVFGLNAEVRWYPKARAPRGFFLAPNAYLYWQKTDAYLAVEYDPATQTYFTPANELSQTAVTLSLGILGGWQWFPGDDFAISFAVGLDGWMHLSGPSNVDSYFFIGNYVAGVFPAMRLEIGYGW